MIPAGAGAVQSSKNKGNLKEAEREIPVKGEYEVIVCGGGPAGVAAAIESGRSGAKTLLVENNGCLGGVWTSGSLTWILDYHHQDGMLKEIVDELIKRGARSTVPTRNDAFSFDLESMKLLLDDLTLDAGVTVRFHTRVCDAVVEDGRITHVITESKSGREAWKARIFVDGVFHEDAIAEVRFGVDVHSVEKKSDHSDISYNRGIKSKPYTIPLRALIAKDVSGLLLAGRCISGDFIAHSSYRVTGPVTTMGQAAGRAAAISAQKNRLPQHISFDEFKFQKF